MYGCVRNIWLLIAHPVFCLTLNNSKWFINHTKTGLPGKSGEKGDKGAVGLPGRSSMPGLPGEKVNAIVYYLNIFSTIFKFNKCLTF